MKITAFFPNLPNGENFTDILARDLVNEEGEFFIVHINYQRPGYHDEFADCKGLDVALTLNPEEAPIILCGFLPESYYISKDEFSNKFYALIAKKRIGYLNLAEGFTTDSWLKKYYELLGDEKEEDLLALELNKMKEYEKAMGSIQHSVSGRFDSKDSRATDYIIQAREIGVMGTDEEVFKTILDFKRDSKDAKFVGKYFPGVFCDLEETLFIGEGVNLKLLNELEELSLTKPITLWTAGDIEKYQKKLISKGILWKLVSKPDFFGAEVEIAYDDLSYEKFHSQFGIKVRKFSQVAGNHNEELELRLEFLHSLLISSGVPEVLINSKFSPILDLFIESKKIREYVKEMGDEKDDNQYNQKLIIIRDFLIN